MSFSFQESLPVCNMHIKTRFLPQGQSSKLSVLSSIQGLQGQVPAAPDHSDPQFSSANVILAISDLCTNLPPETGEKLLSHHSKKGLVSKIWLGVGQEAYERRSSVNLSAGFLE